MQQITKQRPQSEQKSIAVTTPPSFIKGKKLPKDKIGSDTSGVSESITKILGSQNNTIKNLLPRSKKGMNEKISEKEVSSDDKIEKNVIDFTSQMIVDQLIPIHLKEGQTQRNLCAQKFTIVESSNIVLGGIDKRVLTINVVDEFDLKNIKSLNLLQKLDYDIYKIDEVVVKRDTSLKLKQKWEYISQKIKKKQKKDNNSQKNVGKNKIKSFDADISVSLNDIYAEYPDKTFSLMDDVDQKFLNTHKEGGDQVEISTKSNKDQSLKDQIIELFDDLQGLRNEFEKKTIALLSLLEEKYPGFSDKKEQL